MKYSIGRKRSVDARDNKYLIVNSQFNKKSTLKQRYWDDNGWWGDQQDTPQCVGYSWAHWLEDGPVEQSGTPPIVNPEVIYTEAQKIDEWSGENYDGTSVRAGAKYLKSRGFISAYLWGRTLDTLVNTVLNVGPVVVGTNWYYNMFFPNRRTGIISVKGRLVGGHAYVINGVDIRKRMFRIKNSWGRSWGINGSAYISFADMAKLIRMNGEICLAVETQVS